MWGVVILFLLHLFVCVDFGLGCLKREMIVAHHKLLSILFSNENDIFTLFFLFMSSMYTLLEALVHSLIIQFYKEVIS